MRRQATTGYNGLRQASMCDHVLRSLRCATSKKSNEQQQHAWRCVNAAKQGCLFTTRSLVSWLKSLALRLIGAPPCCCIQQPQTVRIIPTVSLHPLRSFQTKGLVCRSNENHRRHEECSTKTMHLDWDRLVSILVDLTGHRLSSSALFGMDTTRPVNASRNSHVRAG